MLSFICLIWFSNPGKADIGPDPWAPGSNIGPSIPTNVRMVEEYVQMDLIEASAVEDAWLRFPQSGFVAQVQADFRMKNLGTTPEELKVYFPLGMIREDDFYELDITDFQVWVDDQPVEIEQVMVPDEKASGINYVSAYFSVHFPVDQEVFVRVKYTIGSHFVPGVGGMEVTQYIFQTGAGWKDNIGKAVMVVNLPDESSPESVMSKPEGGKINGRSISWTWTNFEPTQEDDFSMVLVNPGSWKVVQLLRQQVKQNPQDGAAWTRLGTEYLYLAAGKINIEYPYFMKLAKEALMRGAQLSPYDAEPHFRLYEFYSFQIGKLWQDPMTQAECDLIVSEMNAFLKRSNTSNAYAQGLDIIMEHYGDMNCPNKPKLNTQRGDFPTLTATPELELSPMPTRTEIPNMQEKWSAFEKTRKARYQAMLPTKTPNLTPSRTLPPTHTLTATRTPSTKTKTPTLVPTETISPTPKVPAPLTHPGTNTGVFLAIGLLLSGAAGFSAVPLLGYLRRKRIH